MRRFWFLIAVGAAAAIVPAAQAGSPTFTPSPPGSFTDTTCGFDVSIQGSAGQTEKDFSDGTVIVTGPLSATFSANGKTITVTIPGPLVAISGHGFYGEGLYGGPLQLPDGQLLLAVAAGTVDVSAFPAVLVHGAVVLNLCTALAP
jgi:hypothetical protein